MLCPTKKYHSSFLDITRDRISPRIFGWSFISEGALQKVLNPNIASSPSSCQGDLMAPVPPKKVKSWQQTSKSGISMLMCSLQTIFNGIWLWSIPAEVCHCLWRYDQGWDHSEVHTVHGEKTLEISGIQFFWRVVTVRGSQDQIRLNEKLRGVF